MIDAMIPQNEQYYYATLYRSRQDTNGENFQYELLDEARYSYGQVINNLIATQGRKTVKSNWDMGFKKGMIVSDEDNVRWYIQEVVVMKESVNAQTNYFLKINPSSDFVLSLVMIENPEELD